MNPKVTFIVPCYNLAHLLPECLNSILSQTYPDFEILVMDDCSPDSTPDVAHSFRDPRVVHVRNEKNLGHLANYNKGIALARGAYIWLVSADDGLRVPYVLERYVRFMEDRPRVGFIFCPPVALVNDRDTGVIHALHHGASDAVFDGLVFLRRLMRFNCVSAPSAMVRRTCYDRVGRFPPDMPFAADWYMWCAFAAEFDVGYMAEPMVWYRQHDSNMTHQLARRDLRILIEDDLAVRWRIARRLDTLNLAAHGEEWWMALAEDYAKRIVQKEEVGWEMGLSVADVQSSIRRHASTSPERSIIGARACLLAGDDFFYRGRIDMARTLYRDALGYDPRTPKTWSKYLLCFAGPRAARIRAALSQLLAHQCRVER
jgi:glycosyltransferase involved in cell wall biosynthesis